MFKRSDLIWLFLTLGALAWWVVAYAQSAPAPLLRKGVLFDRHPAWVLGDHTLHWFQSAYRLELKSDGTFVIPYDEDLTQAQYKGDWELYRENGTIYMSYTEWPASRYASGDIPSFKYTFAWGVGGWKCMGCVHRICRPGVPRPTD